jgi:hypothetical protein
MPFPLDQCFLASVVSQSRPPDSTVFGTPHETEIYVRLQRVDVMFSMVYPDSDNELKLCICHKSLSRKLVLKAAKHDEGML